MRPGDEVEVKRAGRVVTLEGEVHRPGTYQLIGVEGVNELISYYGDGLGVSAKSDMVVLTRRATEGKPESESVIFDLSSAELPALSPYLTFFHNKGDNSYPTARSSILLAC